MCYLYAHIWVRRLGVHSKWVFSTAVPPVWRAPRLNSRVLCYLVLRPWAMFVIWLTTEEGGLPCISHLRLVDSAL